MPENTIAIVAQALSYVGMALAVISMQFKSMRVYYTFQVVAASVFVASYVLLGSYASAILNAWGVVCSLVLLLDKRTRPPRQLIWMLCVLLLCGCVSVYLDGALALLPLIAQMGSTVGMWSRNPARLRLLRLSVVSPLWLVNNVLVHSGGGIATEVFNILSVLISIWRYGWKTLMQDEDAKDKEASANGTSK